MVLGMSGLISWLTFSKYQREVLADHSGLLGGEFLVARDFKVALQPITKILCGHVLVFQVFSLSGAGMGRIGVEIQICSFNG